MNTKKNPQTFLKVQGLCSSIMKIPAHPVVSLHDFHKQLVAVKFKARAIDILCTRGNSMGWFSDMPEGLWDKLGNLRQQQMR